MSIIMVLPRDKKDSLYNDCAANKPNNKNYSTCSPMVNKITIGYYFDFDVAKRWGHVNHTFQNVDPCTNQVVDSNRSLL